MARDWQESVLAERREREDIYLGEETPLSPERRKAFQGLKWFPLDERYRLRDVALHRYPEPRPAALAATGDDATLFHEVGRFEFTLMGEDCALLAFEPAPGEVDEPYVLVPFRDATTGKETYGAGRYLDFEPDARDVYEVDFNRAYHPYCAHDDAWSCTLPPPENRLPMRVEAGERL